MKYLISACFLLLLCTGCASSVHIVNGGKASVDRKESYDVTYQTEMEEGLTAKLSYTNQNGDQHKEKGVVGKWSKTERLKSRQSFKFTVAVKGLKRKANFKILVDGRPVNEYEMLSKHGKYSMRLELP